MVLPRTWPCTEGSPVARPRRCCGLGSALPLALACALLAGPAAAQETPPAAKNAPKAQSSAKKPKTRPPTVRELQKLIDEQKAQIETQEKLITEQAGNIEQLKAQLAQMQQSLDALTTRLNEVETQQAAAAAASKTELDARLKKIEGSLHEKPELLDVVSAGNFPGSFKIPGTDAAMKIGGMVWTNIVQTFSPLGSDTQFLTWSIPAKGMEQAGQGSRLSLGAKPSKFNFDVRAPSEVGEIRAFIEGDFNGANGAFRLRHAYGQYGRMLIGQTWSTFSDPYADHEDIDFEGVNAENVVRQAQVRYTMPLPKGLRLALALEYPTASVTGGAAVNQIPDFIGRITKKIPKGHLQGALVLREVRAQSNEDPSVVHAAPAWGVSASGVLAAGGKGWSKNDRIIFQFNGGKGNARYINDLQSCNCGEDAVFAPDGSLHALTAWGYYAAYEHHWENFPNPLHLSINDFRSSLIWGRVKVDNLSFMPGTSYKQTDRVSLNALWSPVRSVDAGIEYIWGQRVNQDGSRGTATQLQMRVRFLF
jgi:uncharacterized coiled-coil protein SlyX